MDGWMDGKSCLYVQLGLEVGENMKVQAAILSQLVCFRE